MVMLGIGYVGGGGRWSRPAVGAGRHVRAPVDAEPFHDRLEHQASGHRTVVEIEHLGHALERVVIL